MIERCIILLSRLSKCSFNMEQLVNLCKDENSFGNKTVVSRSTRVFKTACMRSVLLWTLEVIPQRACAWITLCVLVVSIKTTWNRSRHRECTLNIFTQQRVYLKRRANYVQKFQRWKWMKPCKCSLHISFHWLFVTSSVFKQS